MSYLIFSIFINNSLDKISYTQLKYELGRTNLGYRVGMTRLVLFYVNVFVCNVVLIDGHHSEPTLSVGPDQ